MSESRSARDVGHGLEPIGSLPTRRSVEWFAGLGGFSVAVTNANCLAIDINQHARRAYELNSQNPYHFLCREIESIEPDTVDSWQAEFWWMSPPCQPFTRKGNSRDLADPRVRGFLNVLAILDRLQPPRLALENVPEFAGSQCCRLLVETLQRCGYRWQEYRFCPSQLGIPNRRKRFYLVAAKQEFQLHALDLPGGTRPTPGTAGLTAFLDTAFPDSSHLNALQALLNVNADSVEAYRAALDFVTPCASAQKPTACFTSAYGRSPVRSGSYLIQDEQIRRFSPSEISRLLGFPAGFKMPVDLSIAKQWKLLGNSLSLYAVREVLKSFGEYFEFSQPAVQV